MVRTRPRMAVYRRLVERMTRCLRIALDSSFLQNVLFGSDRVSHQNGRLCARVMHNNTRVDVGATDYVGALPHILVQLLGQVLVVQRDGASRLLVQLRALGTVRVPRLISVQVRVVVQGAHRLVRLLGLVVLLLMLLRLVLLLRCLLVRVDRFQ